MRELFKSDILRLAKPLEGLKEHTVYFLVNENEIVYVGYSNTPIRRIIDHISTKTFTHYHTLKFKTQEEALKTETEYINSFKPIYNRKDNPDIIKKNIEYNNEITYIDSLHKSDLKINIPNNTYIKKQDGKYYFKIKDVIYTTYKVLPFYSLNGVNYKQPIDTYGEVKNLLK